MTLVNLLVALVDLLASTPHRPLESQLYLFISQSVSMIITWEKTNIPSESIIGLGYPLKKNCHLFERLGLSVRKKMLSVRMAQAICSKKK